MAIDPCSESSGFGMSPRISFSHDLSQTEVVPVENFNPRSDSSSAGFDFCFSQSFEQESSSADELFSNGKILPTQIRGKYLPPKQIHNSNRASLKEETVTTSSDSVEKPQSKSCWSFKRSTSLNCGDGYKRSFICSLPLLLRSNSTGSVQNQKRPLLSKENHKNQSQKQTAKSSSSSSRKPPLKKNLGGSYGNGVRISPVLNVPPPYITRGTANLLGLGSFFSNGNSKNKKK